jgi:hypothetical protein
VLPIPYFGLHTGRITHIVNPGAAELMEKIIEALRLPVLDWRTHLPMQTASFAMYTTYGTDIPKALWLYVLYSAAERCHLRKEKSS